MCVCVCARARARACVTRCELACVCTCGPVRGVSAGDSGLSLFFPLIASAVTCAAGREGQGKTRSPAALLFCPAHCALHGSTAPTWQDDIDLPSAVSSPHPPRTPPHPSPTPRTLAYTARETRALCKQDGVKRGCFSSSCHSAIPPPPPPHPHLPPASLSPLPGGTKP